MALNVWLFKYSNFTTCVNKMRLANQDRITKLSRNPVKPLWTMFLLQRGSQPAATIILGCLLVISILTSSGCSSQKQKVVSGKVVGTSMAPTLLGEHRECFCSDCNFKFSFEPINIDETRRKVACPNCGAANRLEDSVKAAADLVLIYPNDAVNRWDVVAFQSPNGQAGIKRAVGMPGELIMMKFGDLYIDNGAKTKPMIKPMSVQRHMRILVHDSHFSPSSVALRRWRSDRKEAEFRQDGGKWFFDADQNSATGKTAPDSNATGPGRIAWLKYHHWRCFRHDESRTKDFAVEDGYGHNQSLSRNLHAMDDLFLEAQLSKVSAGAFAWRFNRGELQTEFQLDLTSWELTVAKHAVSGSLVETEQRPHADIQEEPRMIQLRPPNGGQFPNGNYVNDDQIRIEFSSFDGELVVLVQGTEVFRCQSPSERSKVAMYPLEIGASGSNVAVERIRVWRDVYYFPISEEAGDAHPIVAGEGFILLGDNVPLSIDSRHWEKTGIHSSKMIGVVRSKGEVGSQ